MKHLAAKEPTQVLLKGRICFNAHCVTFDKTFLCPNQNSLQCLTALQLDQLAPGVGTDVLQHVCPKLLFQKTQGTE